MGEYSVIGKRIPRVDGIVKTTGEAKYTVDLVLPGMLYGKILRSPHPHARILNIDTSRAGRLPGVRAVVTGKDTAGIKYNCLPYLCPRADELMLAIDKVRYIGDEVAAVAAIDEDIAEEALELIEVEYEELPAVFTPEEAMKEGAPRIHDDIESNISLIARLGFGDVDKGFQESDYIREDTFLTQPVLQCSLEPHAILASFESSGQLTVWASNQKPYHMHYDLAKLLQIPENKVRVIAPFIGGGFGGKADVHALDFCASLLSRKAGKPVKIVHTREEEFTCTRGRHAYTIHLKTGVKKDGTLLAKECKAISNNGAYNNQGPQIIYVSGTFLTLLYRLPNIKYEGYLVYTNNPTCGAHRGYGIPQTRYADDSQLDLIAEDLGIDPVELRLKNGRRPGDVTPKKMRVTSCGLAECIQKVAERSGWKEKRGKLEHGRGIGLACGDYVSGAREFYHDTAAAFIKVHDDGSATLFIGAPDIGQGSNTVLCQIAAEELGVRPENVKVISADTETSPVDNGTHSSRVTFIVGNAVKLAAHDAREQILKLVAEELEANIEDLEARDGRVYVKGTPEKGIEVANAVRLSLSKKGIQILGKGSYDPPSEVPDILTGEGNISPSYSFQTQSAEVEVDRETGKVKVKKMVGAIDCGFALNPMSVEGNLEGSIEGGMGQALSEELIRRKGLTLNPSFLDYKMPTVLDMPEVETILVETIDPEGPFGAKGCSEGTQVPTSPAIANAIQDAIGIRIKDLPLNPEKVLKALEEKKR